MFLVSVKWKDGTVTHDTYNDPYHIAPHFTRSEIEAMYDKWCDKIEYVNICYESMK